MVIASEGISITLKCKTKGSPRPKITWYKDVELLGICEGGSSRKCQSFTKMNTEFRKNSITIHRLASKHSGKYTCEVENFLGKSSSSAQMTVFSKYAYTSCMYFNWRNKKIWGNLSHNLHEFSIPSLVSF